MIGNWLEPPGELHLAKLVSDEIVCLVSEHHPVTRPGRRPRAGPPKVPPASTSRRCRSTPARSACSREHLRSMGPERRITVRASHFGLIPLMVADSPLVLTTGRLFCSRYVGTQPVAIVRCPDRVSAFDLLPALARPDARLGGDALAARTGARRRARTRIGHAAAARGARAARRTRWTARPAESPCAATCSTSPAPAWGRHRAVRGAAASRPLAADRGRRPDRRRATGRRRAPDPMERRSSRPARPARLPRHPRPTARSSTSSRATARSCSIGSRPYTFPAELRFADRCGPRPARDALSRRAARPRYDRRGGLSDRAQGGGGGPV